MSMERQFKSAKLQLTLTGDQHPKGVNRYFNNVANTVSGEQLTAFSGAIESLTAEHCTNTSLITTEEFVAE